MEKTNVINKASCSPGGCVEDWSLFCPGGFSAASGTWWRHIVLFLSPEWAHGQMQQPILGPTTAWSNQLIRTHLHQVTCGWRLKGTGETLCAVCVSQQKKSILIQQRAASCLVGWYLYKSGPHRRGLEWQCLVAKTQEGRLRKTVDQMEGPLLDVEEALPDQKLSPDFVRRWEDECRCAGEHFSYNIIHLLAYKSKHRCPGKAWILSI